MASKGLKRKVVSLLALILDILSQVPGTEGITVVLTQLNGLLGGAAITHAGVAGTLSKERIAGAVSAIYFLIFLSTYLPVLLPLVPALVKAAGVLSAVRLGCAIAPSDV